MEKELRKKGKDGDRMRGRWERSRLKAVRNTGGGWRFGV